MLSDHSPFRLSVGELVAWVFQSGDLAPTAIGPNRLAEGTAGHTTIQGSRGTDFEREVTISARYRFENIEIELTGRIDGLYPRRSPPELEEIKTTRRQIEAGRPVHWAQATCYGAMYARAHALARVGLTLTYLNLDTREETSFHRDSTAEELEVFVMGLLQNIAPWLRANHDHRVRRDQSLKAAVFPFASLRPGQEEMMKAVQSSIETGPRSQLFIHAPTGIGKTVAVLFPALESLVGGRTQRIFYLSAKGTGKHAALEASDRIVAGGASLRRIVITAKEKICFHPPEARGIGPQGEDRCVERRCPFARGYYDRVRPALSDLLARQRLDAATITEIAGAHRVCPFELSLDASLYVDLVICDYNYFYDPRVYLRRHFLMPSSAVVLVDEAHNLVDRGRSMFSASLSKRAALNARKVLSKQGSEKHAWEAVNRLNRWFIDIAKTLDGRPSQVDRSYPEELTALAEDVIRALEGLFSDQGEHPGGDLLAELYYQAVGFARTAEEYDDDYRFYLKPEHGREVTATLFCVQPARRLTRPTERVRATVYFSGTLVPLQYFISLLTSNQDHQTLMLESPFPKKNRLVSALTSVDTRYRAREASSPALLALIKAVLGASRGNYLVYFPSYAYMAQVQAHYRMEEYEGSIRVQSRAMDEGSREEFLAAFSEDGATAAFAVLGGVFAEGVDLPGRRLHGAVIAGVGLPAVSLEQEIIRDYFDEVNDHGFLYAYVYPGMNRVIQAAGRVIRTETDRGVIVFAGRRFGQEPYRSIWQIVWPDGLLTDSIHELAQRIEAFW